DGRARQRVLGRSTPLIEPRLHVLEPLGAEQAAQQRLPLLAVSEQEAGEPVLRQQDHLQELLPAELEDLVQLVSRLAFLGGECDPAVIAERVEAYAGRLLGQSASAFRR